MRKPGVVGLIAADPDVAAGTALFVVLAELFGTTAEGDDALGHLVDALGAERAATLVDQVRAGNFGPMEKPVWWDRRHDRKDTT